LKNPNWDLKLFFLFLGKFKNSKTNS